MFESVTKGVTGRDEVTKTPKNALIHDKFMDQFVINSCKNESNTSANLLFLSHINYPCARLEETLDTSRMNPRARLEETLDTSRIIHELLLCKVNKSQVIIALM